MELNVKLVYETRDGEAELICTGVGPRQVVGLVEDALAGFAPREAGPVGVASTSSSMAIIYNPPIRSIKISRVTV